MTKLLAFTKYGRNAASTRQRLMQYETHLESAGIEVEYAPLFNESYMDLLARGGKAGLAQIGNAYLRRAVTLITHRRPDMLWVQYEYFPFLPAIMERCGSRWNCPIVVDYDDAIFHMYDDHRRGVVRHLLGSKLRTLIGLASLIIAGNDYIRSYVESVNPRVQVIPTVVDANAYLPGPSRSRDTLVVGWIGSPSTWRYVEPLLPILLPRLQAAGAVFRAIGAGPAATRWPGVEALDWSEDTEIAAVQSMDIGIMPLPDERWAKGKCGYKLIQYMACGLPVIASPVGVNSDIVQHGANGILATNNHEWADAIDMLLNSSVTRADFGRVGRARVEKDYSLQTYGPVLAGLLSELRHL